MPVYTGTAAEQWELAGIDLALGLITAADLHELGCAIFREIASEDWAECERLKHELNATESDLRDSEDEVSKLEDEVEELEKEIRELKKRILRLEGKPEDADIDA